MKLVFLTPFLFAITYAELAHRGEPEVYDRRITTTGDWMITVPFYGFVIDICINKPAERNDETMLFCIGGKPEKANDVGCPEDFCGVRAYGKDHPSLSGTVTGVNTMTRCIWLYVQPREMIINEYKNIEKCHWARQDDGKLRFQIRTFPPGFVVTLKRVEDMTSYINYLFAIYGWILLPISFGILAIVILVVIFMCIHVHFKDKEIRRQKLELEDFELQRQKRRQEKKEKLERVLLIQAEIEGIEAHYYNERQADKFRKLKDEHYIKQCRYRKWISDVKRDVEYMKKNVKNFSAKLLAQTGNKQLADLVSEQYCFQNRHDSDPEEWVMFSYSASEGAAYCEYLIKKADDYLNALGMKYKSNECPIYLHSEIRHANTKGYIWARCLAREYHEWISPSTSLILYLFSDHPYSDEREMILRDIKIDAANLINIYGKLVDEISFYPYPLLYRIYDVHDHSHFVFPPEGCRSIVPCPKPIIQPPKTAWFGEWKLNDQWYNLTEKRMIIQKEDESERLYEEEFEIQDIKRKKIDKQIEEEVAQFKKEGELYEEQLRKEEEKKQKEKYEKTTLGEFEKEEADKLKLEEEKKKGRQYDATIVESEHERIKIPSIIQEPSCKDKNVQNEKKDQVSKKTGDECTLRGSVNENEKESTQEQENIPGDWKQLDPKSRISTVENPSKVDKTQSESQQQSKQEPQPEPPKK